MVLAKHTTSIPIFERDNVQVGHITSHRLLMITVTFEESDCDRDEDMGSTKGRVGL